MYARTGTGGGSRWRRVKERGAGGRTVVRRWRLPWWLLGEDSSKPRADPRQCVASIWTQPFQIDCSTGHAKPRVSFFFLVITVVFRLTIKALKCGIQEPAGTG
jgi:hypothetical protein